MKIKAYHISHRKHRESILKNGLLPSKKTFGRIRYGLRLFFSTDAKDLGFDYVGYDNVDCWQFEIDVNLLKRDLISGSKNHFYIKRKIPSSQIKLFSSH